jgi:hypothetical protein
MHRYSTRFQMTKAQPIQVPKAQPIQPVQAVEVPDKPKAEVQDKPKAEAQDKPKAEVQDKPKAEAQDKPKTHPYETRLQSRLKKERADCKKISDLIQAATITPDIADNPVRLYAVAALFEELYQTTLWMKHMRFNAIIRMKIGEFRNTIHMIRTCYDETVGIVLSGRTIHMGYDYITAARRLLYAMDALEKLMNS